MLHKQKRRASAWSLLPKNCLKKDKRQHNLQMVAALQGCSFLSVNIR